MNAPDPEFRILHKFSRFVAELQLHMFADKEGFIAPTWLTGISDCRTGRKEIFQPLSCRKNFLFHFCPLLPTKKNGSSRDVYSVVTLHGKGITAIIVGLRSGLIPGRLDIAYA